MKQFLKNKKDIIAWLDSYGIKNYTLVPSTKYGFVVNVDGDVELSYKKEKIFYKNRFVHYVYRFRIKRFVNAWGPCNKKIKFIPVKFNIINGDFAARSNEITNMRSMPKRVKGRFNLFYNKLKNLKGLPKKIDGSIELGLNKIENLIGSPKVVYGNFSVEHNYKIKSLVGGPEVVEGTFVVDTNCLTDLVGSPKIVKYSFCCRSNCLTSLKGISEHIEKNLMIENSYEFECFEKNLLTEFDYLPKKLGGEIKFDKIPGLERYKDMTTAQIMDMVAQRKKLAKKAKKEHSILNKTLAMVAEPGISSNMKNGSNSSGNMNGDRIINNKAIDKIKI